MQGSDRFGDAQKKSYGPRTAVPLYVAVAVRIQNLLQMVIFFYNSSILVSAGDIIGTTGSWVFFVACNKFCILTVTATYTK